MFSATLKRDLLLSRLYQSHFWRTPSLNVFVSLRDVTQISSSGQHVIQIPSNYACRGITALLARIELHARLPSQAFAQSDDGDPEMRIQQLENQLRQLTGQNEELQHQNQLLQERLNAMQGGAQPPPAASLRRCQPNVATLPPPQPPNPAYRQQHRSRPAGL